MKLFYRQFGQGPNLIILHGLLGMSDNWASLAQRYSAHFTVWLPDLRNHGNSPHHPEHTYPLMCDDIQAFMDQHGISDASFIGHSMGGKAAMLFAIQHPDKTNKLVIADIGLDASPGEAFHLALIEKMAALNLSVYRSRNDMREIFEDLAGNGAIAGLMLKNTGRRHGGGYFWKPNFGVLAGSLGHIAGALSVTGMFTNPVMLIRGGLSDYVSAEDRDRMYDYFPLLHEKVIDGAGHWLHAEKPEDFLKVTLPFLCNCNYLS